MTERAVKERGVCVVGGDFASADDPGTTVGVCVALAEAESSSGVGAVTQAIGSAFSGNVNGVESKASPEVAQKLREFASASGWGKLVQEELTSSDYYFNSYAHLGIHEEMLKDSVRTGAYRRAIQRNGHLFKDKIVLDVGCGTGVLSMFAAKAGAAKVYAIECSEIASVATRLVEENNLSHIVTVIKGKAEEVEVPESVDVIISEWMGYFLLYESMLDTVLFCRDKWLKKDTGMIFPDKATLYIAALEDGEFKTDKFDFWDNCYGLNFSSLKTLAMEEPLVDTVNREKVISAPAQILSLDLLTCTKMDLDFVSTFSLTINRTDFVHGVVAWFDCEFSACHQRVLFSTSPANQYTHWKQTVFYFPGHIIANQGDVLNGVVAVRKNATNPRDLDLKIQFDFQAPQHKYNHTQIYRLR